MGLASCCMNAEKTGSVCGVREVLESGGGGLHASLLPLENRTRMCGREVMVQGSES